MLPDPLRRAGAAAAAAAKATRKRIAALPRPRSLSACIEALRQSRGGDEGGASKSSIDRADAAEAGPPFSAPTSAPLFSTQRESISEDGWGWVT